MKVLELKIKTIPELIQLEEKSRAELFALRFQATLGNLQKSHKIKYLKVQIARILTILSEREKNGEKIDRNIKVDLSDTFKNIEKESKVFFKKRKKELKAQLDEMKKQQNGDFSDANNNKIPNVNDDFESLFNKEEFQEANSNLESKNLAFENNEKKIIKTAIKETKQATIKDDKDLKSDVNKVKVSKNKNIKVITKKSLKQKPAKEESIKQKSIKRTVKK